MTDARKNLVLHIEVDGTRPARTAGPAVHRD